MTFPILAIVLGLLDACRPQNIGKRIQEAICGVEESIHEAGRCHVPGEIHSNLTFKERLKGIHLQAAVLREVTLRSTLCPWKEFKVVVKGHSFRLFMCLWDIKALEIDLEIFRAEKEQHNYRS
ncbi:hypothetical protein BDZ94DRAFT_1234649 [Collybia nuda]|uniref:Uncharacterized protein n=1 Tax=Collybia nuda TaxID=64659 RepID=A0A9P6CKM8_9AGAR|nr:hypothetical protein BDZ94DRAFT_1234649 [Collybia nuda]